LRAALLLFVAVCAAAWMAPRSEASVPCYYKRPTASDGVNLRVAVRNAVGPRASRLVIQYFCGFSAHGQADLQSPFVHLTQGVREWMTIHCQRQDAVNWQCDPLELHRGTKLRATIGGNTRVVDAEFPPGMPVATARDLVLRAVNAMEAAEPPPRCENSPLAPPAFAQHQWGEVHGHVLNTAGQPPFEVTASVDADPGAGTTHVWFAGSLGIEFPSACWIEVETVVVT